MSTEIAVQAVTPMALIERASAQGASIEQMQQLFDLKLRVEADEARKAFNEAMAKFKRNPPRINKNVQKQAGPIALSYASLDNVVDTVTPVLSAVGIRHRWDVKQEAGLISVTCILSHDMGHSESTTLTAPYDASGGKNAIQAIASANTYLQRYTLLAATGLAAGGTDDDGVLASPKLGDMEFVELRESIEGSATKEELKTKFTAAYKRAEMLKDKGAMADFIRAKDNRKEQL
jgi:hypothetical protein